MEREIIAMFGESEKGDFQTAYFCRDLTDLVEYLGNPPEDTMGLHYAVQALMLQKQLIYFRVHEEGFSEQDYQLGFRLLENQSLIPRVNALCMPGVGDAEILDASIPLCYLHNTIVLTNEADLYDYLTSA